MKPCLTKQLLDQKIPSISDLFEGDCWIGGFFDANRKFRWTDGTSVDFQNWDVDQPNNEEDKQYCALMYVRRGATGVWQDGQCARASVLAGGTSKALCRRKGK